MWLSGVAVVRATETKDLPIGECADPALTSEVGQVIAGHDGVECTKRLLTAQFAPDQVIVITSVAFQDDWRAEAIERLVDAMTDDVLERIPEVGRLFVEPQSPESDAAARRSPFDIEHAPGAAQPG